MKSSRELCYLMNNFIFCLFLFKYFEGGQILTIEAILASNMKENL